MMGLIGGALGYRLLRTISRDGETGYCNGDAYKGRSKLETLMGPQIWRELSGKTVIDFGCGRGELAIEIAARCGGRVIGLDIREHVLAQAREAAEQSGVSDRCSFVTGTTERADAIICVDSFEHFDDPSGILRIMKGLVREDGEVIIVFGPPWYHPLGGHLFSVFPWAHLIFTEKSLIRWRSDFKSDGATRFCEIEGGLNRMTIRGFKRLVDSSGFDFASFEAVPIRKARLFSNALTREFVTSIVRCRLVQRSSNARRAGRGN